MTAVPFDDGVPEPLTAREQTIRAIHNYADYLTAHPEVPAPRAVSGYTFLDHRDVAEESERVATVLRWAEAIGIKPHETLHQVGATLQVIQRDDISITQTFGAYLDLERPKRYVIERGEGDA